MEVTREMQIDFLHRQHLGIAATSSTALDTETGTQRRFSQGHSGLLANLIQAQRQTDANGGLTDTSLRRTDSRHQYQSALLHFLLVNQAHRYFGHITSVRLYLFRGNPQLCGNLGNGQQFAFPCYLYVCLHIELCF